MKKKLRKTRPAVIVNDNAIGILPLKVIVPITDWKRRFDAALWMVKIEPDNENGLRKTSVADAFQVRSLSQKRFVRRLGVLPNDITLELTNASATVLQIEVTS